MYLLIIGNDFDLQQINKTNCDYYNYFYQMILPLFYNFGLNFKYITYVSTLYTPFVKYLSGYKWIT